MAQAGLNNCANDSVITAEKRQRDAELQFGNGIKNNAKARFHPQYELYA